MLGAVYLGSAILAAGQAAPASDPLEALRVQMEQLRVSMNEMNDQLAGARRESQELRRELQAVREQLDVVGSQSAAASGSGRPSEQSRSLDDRVAALAEDQQLQSAKVEDQYQTKVESGSKYRLRLSGLVLFNVLSTHGAVDNLDSPRMANAKVPGESNGSFAATARQSQFSLDVHGPEWRGAKTSGDATFDFFGGFPSNPEGVTSGLVRLRTAKLALDWAKTSIVAGQDTPFFSPLSPTSLASTAYPALSSAGNIWTWTPQVRVERRIPLSERTTAILQGGILDPLTGEPPAEYNRMPTAGEASRAPAYAMRFGLQRTAQERLATIGAGAYYSRQNWGFGRSVDSWAATMDWDLPLGRWFSVSGEAYRGRAIAGLGAGVSGSVLFAGPSSVSTSSVLPLESAGGWSQLKFKPLERIEFNAAFGEDYPFHFGLRFLSIGQIVQGLPVSRNKSGFFNAIYQPRSSLLFSVEYRRLWTSSFDGPMRVADQVSVSSGIVF
jgi:hypothetical protein